MATGNNGGSKNLRPWKPGQSGNPSGRPKGIARQFRDAIDDDPSGLAQIILDLAYDPGAKPADRLAAAREYLDRSYGKAPAFAPVEGEDPLGLTGTDREIASVLDELAGRRQATPPSPSQGEAVGGDSTGRAATA